MLDSAGMHKKRRNIAVLYSLSNRVGFDQDKTSVCDGAGGGLCAQVLPGQNRCLVDAVADSKIPFLESLKLLRLMGKLAPLLPSSQALTSFLLAHVACCFSYACLLSVMGDGVLLQAARKGLPALIDLRVSANRCVSCTALHDA